MLSFFNKKKQMNIDIIEAPVIGEAVPSGEIADPTFKEELLGRGMAIKPTEGKVFAPVDGTVEMVFDTLHAISLRSGLGAEILIHVGLDTLKLQGKYFNAHVKAGDVVRKGQLLLEFDLEGIKSEGYDTIIPIVICNTDAYKDVISNTGTKVKQGDPVLELVK